MREKIIESEKRKKTFIESHKALSYQDHLCRTRKTRENAYTQKNWKFDETGKNMDFVY
jgi:hypothetical protein